MNRPIIGSDREIQRLYWLWNAMMRRCYKPATKQFEDYGGRGIRVCERWHAFWNFHDDMGPRPAHCVLDRIDNNRGYEPANCRWASYSTSNANRRWAIVVDGVTLKEHMRAAGQLDRYRMVTKRIKRGIPVRDAIETPSTRERP